MVFLGRFYSDRRAKVYRSHERRLSFRKPVGLLEFTFTGTLTYKGALMAISSRCENFYPCDVLQVMFRTNYARISDELPKRGIFCYMEQFFPNLGGWCDDEIPPFYRKGSLQPKTGDPPGGRSITTLRIRPSADVHLTE